VTVFEGEARKSGPWKTRKHRKQHKITVTTKNVTENTIVSPKNSYRVIVYTFGYIIPNFYAYWWRIEGAIMDRILDFRAGMIRG
jgi:hypothetical protein